MILLGKVFMRFMYYYIIILLLFSSCYSKESLREQVVSLYEQGKQWEEAVQADSAVSYYLQSFSLAKELKDDSLAGDIGNTLGEILNIQSLYNYALSIHQEAYSYNSRLKDKTAASRSLRGIGRDYIFNFTKDSLIYRIRQDSALAYFIRAKNMIPHIKSKKEISSIYNNLCGIYINLKEYKKALEYNQKSIYWNESKLDIYKNYVLRATIYFYLQYYDSSVYYGKQALLSDNLYTQHSACHQLAKTFSQMGIADSALYLKETFEIHARIEQQNREEEIMNFFQKNTQNKLKIEKRLMVFYITFVLLALFFSGFVLYRKFNRRKLLKKEYLISLKEAELAVEQEQTHILREELEERKHIINYADLKKQKREEEEKIVSSIIQIGEECATRCQKDLFFKNIVGKLNEESTFANEERQVLIREISQYFTPYIQDISRYFQLADEDYFICCLTLLGFSTKHCAIFRGVGEAAIRVQRRRIKEKLKGFFHSEKLYNSIFGKK